MYARITIQSGIAVGTSYLIEGRVARVGSHPQSEVCLPTSTIPEHALTLEFHDESCRVYNRCRDSVYVGAQSVGPNEVVEWPETDILQIGTDTELLLDFDAETHESYSDFDDELHELDSDAENLAEAGSERSESDLKSAKSGSAKTILQLVVTIACIAGCVALLVREQNRTQGPSSGPGFSEIVASAVENPEISPALIQRIQFAEAQRIRGREQIALVEFQSIRDDLVASTIGASDTEIGVYSEILQFIKTRIN